jgi:hypothetical protein
MTRWPVKRNLFEGKPKLLEWRKPARMTASGRAPAKQQAFPRTPAGATTGNHDGELSEDSEAEEEERGAPNGEEQQLKVTKAEIEELKMSNRAEGKAIQGQGKGWQDARERTRPRMAREEPQAKPDRQDSPLSRGAVVLVLTRVRWEVRWTVRSMVSAVRSTTKAKSPRSSSSCSSRPSASRGATRTPTWSNDASRAVRYNMNRSVTAFKTLPSAFTCVSWSLLK